MDKTMTPALDDAVTNALFAMNAACDLLQIMCESFFESPVWRDGREGRITEQAAFRLLQNAAGSYLSLTTTAMSLLDAARSRLDEADS